MSEQHLKNAKLLLEHFKGLDAGDVDLSSWVRHPPRNWAESSGVTKLQHACGTVACIAGHACSLPEFRAQGLRYSWELSPPPADVDALSCGWFGPEMEIDGDLETDPEEVAMRLFGDPYLFGPRGCHPADHTVRTPYDNELVIHRLTKLIDSLSPTT